LATVSDDRTVRVWDPLTGALALRGPTCAVVLSGSLADIAATASAARSGGPLGIASPCIGIGGGAIPALLLAIGMQPREVERLAVESREFDQRSRLLHPRLPRSARIVRLLERRLADRGVFTCGHLRVPVAHSTYGVRFHAAVVDVATNNVVLLPRDARRLGIEPFDIPLVDLTIAAATQDAVVIGGRRFASALDRQVDVGAWFADPPRGAGPLRVIQSEGGLGRRMLRFTDELDVIIIDVPERLAKTPPTARERRVLAWIGAEHARRALVEKAAFDEPAHGPSLLQQLTERSAAPDPAGSADAGSEG
jgi:hypothetical protein